MGDMTMAGEHEAFDVHEPPLLSLVLPVYNEHDRLPRTLRILCKYLSRRRIAAEIIVVDDGSADDTAALVQRRMLAWPALRLISTPHRGKGHAVRTGLLAAQGAYVCFCDADLSMPITELPKFLPPLRPDIAVAIASREAPGAHRYGEPVHRHLLGRVFNLLVRTLALPGIQDSQCGFKCFHGEVARQLAAAQTLDGWGFDVELLYLARRWGYGVVEIPVEWRYAPSSRVSPLRDSWRMARDVLAVRRNAQAGRYDKPAALPGRELAQVAPGERGADAARTPSAEAAVPPR
jgi:dolichyl-phosphate beta-glucosyltransferase